MLFKQSLNNMTWSICQRLKSNTMTDQMFIKYLDINKQSRTEAQNIKRKQTLQG